MKMKKKRLMQTAVKKMMKKKEDEEEGRNVEMLWPNARINNKNNEIKVNLSGLQSD